MRSLPPTGRWLAVIASWGVALGACADGGPSSPSLNPVVPGRLLTGQFRLVLTDNHVDGLDEVHVWITGFSTQLEGGDPISFDKELGDVELLSLRDRTIEAADAEVPAGTYEYVAFHIDESRSSVVEAGATKALKVPDEDVRVLGPFVVPGGGTTTVTLDFDAEQSLVKNGDGSWSLKPVVVVIAIT